MLTHLVDYYNTHKLEGYRLNTKKHRWFKDELRGKLKYIEDLTGEKRFGVYVFALLNGYWEAPPPCEQCGEPVKGVRKTQFNLTCSRACTIKQTSTKAQKTMIERYGGIGSGSEVIRKKVEATNLKRYGAKTFFETDEFTNTNYAQIHYGVDHFSKSEEIQEKKRQLRLIRMTDDEYFNYKLSQMATEERWGADHPMKTERGKQLHREALIKKYGTDNINTLPEIKEKICRTNLERYGVEYYTQTEEYKEHMLKQNTSIDRFLLPHHNREHIEKYVREKAVLEELYNEHGSITHLSEFLGINNTTMGRILRHHKIEIKNSIRTSAPEMEIREFMESIGLIPEYSNRAILDGLELDIVCNEHKFAIEFNGMYWHSVEHKERLYHQKKTLETRRAGYRLLHIWESDWSNENKRNIIKNRIKHFAGLSAMRVFGRRCKIIKPTNKQKSEFFNKHHIQGNGRSHHNYALEHDNEIVAMLSIENTKGVSSINRYATSCSVVGGFSKLLKHFITEEQPTVIETFASLDYGYGETYKKYGFEEVGITQPNYVYFSNSGELLSRHQAMKHKLKDLLSNFNESLSEQENMRNHGYRRVYDAGSVKYRLTLAPNN